MVAIKDMEMPSCCAKCEFKQDYCFYCNKLQKRIPQSNFFDSRLPDCPLVEIEEHKQLEDSLKVLGGTLNSLGSINQMLELENKQLKNKFKVGKWILIDKENNIWKCTKCIELGKDDWWKLNSGTPQDNKMDYCPHCGAEMRGSENV